MISKSRFAIVYVLFILTTLFLYAHHNRSVTMNRPFSAFPSTIGDWRLLSESQFNDSVIAVLKPTDYLFRTYRGKDGKAAHLYIGFHSGAKGEGGIHSPKHCLPGSGWFQASSKRTTIDLEGAKLNMVQAVYQKGDTKELFLYWFQVKGKSISDEYTLKMAELTNSILHSRKDEAFVRISIPFDGDDSVATANGMRFVRDFYPTIQSFLPS